GESHEGSREIIVAIAKEAEHAVGPLQLTSAIPKKALMIAAAAAVVALAVIGVQGAVDRQRLNTGLQRVFGPLANNSLTQILTVTPGNSDILAHTDVEVSTRLGGRVPTRAQLVCTSADGKRWTLLMSAPSPGVPDHLTTKLERLEQDTMYRVV